MQESTLVKFTAATLVATVLSVPVFAAETIKLGLAGAHSGDLAAYGLPTKEAAELVVAEINAKGGINGKQVELKIMDDQCKPELATNVATKLVSEGVNLVIGHICSGATKAALDQHAQVLAAENHPNLRVGSIAPGVVDTDMQAAIRSSDAAVFPLRGRFDELHRQDLLQSPAATAAQVAAMIAAADFGQTVCRDVREP